MPLVSFLIPAYDAEPWIEASVRSALDQSFRDFEVLVVDDGSADGTLDILRRIQGEHDRLRILSRPNTGLVGALNDGLAELDSRYCARLDADDLAHPDRLRRQVAVLEEQPTLAVVGAHARLIDEAGRPLGRFEVPESHEEIEALHLSGRSAIHHPAATIRVDALRHAGGYLPESFPTEDYDLWLRLGEIGRLGNVQAPLITKRQTLDGIVGSNLDRMQRSAQAALDQAWKRRGLAQPVPRVKPGLRTREAMLEQWVWLSIAAREFPTARHYAAQLLRRKPWRLRAWKAAAVAWRRG